MATLIRKICNSSSLLPLNCNRGWQVSPIRKLLSASFYCNEQWNQRLKEPTLSNVNADFLISQLFVQFEKNTAVSSVDMEVFSNRLFEVHPTQLDVVENLLHKFRRCHQAVGVIDSMAHAVIRCYLELDQLHRLIPILQNKKDYGLFPDDKGFSMVMDHSIKQGDFYSAVLMAIEQMLQEDFSHSTTKMLSLHACSQYLHSERASLLAPVDSDNKPVLDDDEEEYRVVNYLPVHNYDDHFDLRDEKNLIGKTFVAVSKESEDNPVYTSYHLIGLAMSEKLDQAIKYLEEQILNESRKIHRQAIDILGEAIVACKYRTETINREPGYELFEDSEYNFRITLEEKKRHREKFQVLKGQLFDPNLLDSDIQSDTEELVKRTLENNLSSDINGYQKQLAAWNQQREVNVELQHRALTLRQQQTTLRDKIDELTKKEELLNYFTRQNEVNLAVLKTAEPKVEVGVIDMEDYVAEPGKRSKKAKM